MEERKKRKKGRGRKKESKNERKEKRKKGRKKNWKKKRKKERDKGRMGKHLIVSILFWEALYIYNNANKTDVGTWQDKFKMCKLYWMAYVN